MTNREFYKDEIINLIKNGKKGSNSLCEDFIIKKILPFYGVCCNDVPCEECNTLKVFWLDEEYKEPEVDWSKVAVDTPILVRANERRSWLKRHFAKYENGHVFTWVDGKTSFSVTDKSDYIMWYYAKLCEEEVL